MLNVYLVTINPIGSYHVNARSPEHAIAIIANQLTIRRELRDPYDEINDSPVVSLLKDHPGQNFSWRKV